MSKRYVFDLETNSIEFDKVTKIHCLVLWDIDACVMHSFGPGQIEQGIARLAEADLVCGHNIICYDLPIIEKLYGLKPKAKVLDTLVCTRLIWTDLDDDDFRMVQHGKMNPKYVGSHSLKAWGFRIGIHKDDFHESTDWAEWSQEMQAYCEQDVRVNEALRQHIEKQQYSELALEIEHEFRQIIYLQEVNGFCFNEQAAVELLARLTARKQELDAILQKAFPPKWIEMKTPQFYVVMKGDEVFAKCSTKGGCQDWLKNRFPPKDRAGFSIEAGPPTQKPDPFKPGSRQQIAERLIEKYGWVPTQFTESGQVAVEDEILEKLPYPEAKVLAEYLTIEKRIGQISTGENAWLKLLKPDGRIHGSVNTNGAVTGRCTHKKPNVTQVPAVYSPYGKECRGLFSARKGWSLVGNDGEGLELRCMAHYMFPWDQGAYANTVVHGRKEDKTDVHNVNARALELSRDDAKTWIYQYLYGGGDELLGSSVPPTPEEIKRLSTCAEAQRVVAMLKRKNSWHIAKGQPQKTRKITPELVATIVKGAHLRSRFEKKTPALASLRVAVEEKVKERGYLIGIDGRHIRIRSKHAALNALFQSAGAIAMKLATILFVRSMRAAGYEQNVHYALVAHVHDEFQVECLPELAETVATLAKQAIHQAGVQLKFKCPLSGDAKIGFTWADTH